MLHNSKLPFFFALLANRPSYSSHASPCSPGSLDPQKDPQRNGPDLVVRAFLPEPAPWGFMGSALKETSNVTDYTFHKLILRIFGNVAAHSSYPPSKLLTPCDSRDTRKVNLRVCAGGQDTGAATRGYHLQQGHVDSPRADSSERRFYNPPPIQSSHAQSRPATLS